MKTNKHTDIRNENGTYRDWVINDIDFDCDELDEWNMLYDATDDNGDALPETLVDAVDAMETKRVTTVTVTVYTIQPKRKSFDTKTFNVVTRNEKNTFVYDTNKRGLRK